MARKYDLISELYSRYSKIVTTSPDNWKSFLASACRNYKLRFDEQLLVYAQKPNATAVLEIEKWNGNFNRWVNKGATGIAVFADEDRSSQRLTHYFDISDTHEGRFSRNVPIWNFSEENTKEIIETLENTFGELKYKDTLIEAIVTASENAVEDNIQDYAEDLENIKKDSLLSDIEGLKLQNLFRQTITDSVSYMVMSRLGINPEDYFDKNDFQDITKFNTNKTLQALGIATSDIAQMGLTEIAKTIFSLEKNRTIEDIQKEYYNKNEIKTERRNNNEQTSIHDAGRLPSSKPNFTPAATSGVGTLRRDETEVSQGISQGDILQSSDGGETDGASLRNRTESNTDGRDISGANGEAGRSNGEPKSDRYDVVGSEDEQYSQSGKGDSESGSDFRIDYYDRSNEKLNLPFFGNDDTINEILLTTPHLKATKEQIKNFLETDPNRESKIEYIKGIFNNDYTELILADGRRVGYKTYQNVLHLWEGSYLSRTAESYYDWGVIAAHFEGLKVLGELNDVIRPLPSVEGQYESMFEKAEQKRSAFTFTQEIIDAVICRGSGVSEGKLRIYEQFQKSLSSKENADFLRNEYGWGGSYPVIIGTGIDETHDGKGIALSKGLGKDAPKITLTWSQVEKRIKELISVDRYLNAKEKEKYPTWLTEQEEKRNEILEKQNNRDILNTSPEEKEIAEVYKYEYHLGDTVYLDNSEYEILDSSADRVKLFDAQFPMFNKEISREEFDERVKISPLNDHLRVISLPLVENPLVGEKSDENRTEFEQKQEAENSKSGIYQYKVGDKVFVDEKECEIIKIDEFYVDLKESKTGEIIDDLYRTDFEDQIKENSKNDGLKIADLYAGENDWDIYNSIKENNKNRIVLYPMGDFYEVYEKDAKTVSEALSLVLTHKNIDGTQIALCGFPKKNLETYMDMLTDRGHELALVTEEKDRKAVWNITSINKDTPIKTIPVGRLNYTDLDGTVTYTAEYTNPKQFIEDIEREIKSKFSFDVEIYENALSPEEIEKIRIQPVTVDIIKSPYERESLPKLLFEFLKDNDFYNMQDSFQVGETDEDGISKIENILEDKKSIENILEYIDGLEIENSESKYIQEKIKEELNFLIEQEEPETDIKPNWENKKQKEQLFDKFPNIPLSARNNFDLINNPVDEVGKKERYKRNIEAIKILKSCDKENRFATSDEQIILSKYVGWGGIPEAFDANNSSWSNEYLELKSLLDENEYNAAKESTLTAFYTPPEVISAIYKVMSNMGFREGNILEPSCGIGNFIGMLPKEMQNSKVYGVELDNVSAGIAQQLYQKSSIATQGFEETNLPDSFFDVVVGNVPFGDFKVYDKRYDKQNFLIHDYFFAKSLDKLRPGGIMALITSKGTMDKENPSVRKYIAQRADLLGAVRLPNNTFKGNAGTEVVSDILILQKRDRIVDIEPNWVHLNFDENGRKMNTYFVEHPENVLGEWKTVSGRFGNEDTVVPYENSNLKEQLNEAISNINGEFILTELEDEIEETDNSIPADPTVRNFSYTVLEDKVYYRENSRMTPPTLSSTAENRIKGMIEIRDIVRNLIELQTDDYPDDEIKSAQTILNESYDKFTKKYGLINDRANKSAFAQDSSYSLLSALEILDDEGKLERKADMFSKRTIKPHIPVTEVDTASEAFALSMGEKACVDMDYMCELTAKSEDEIFNDLKGVIFLNPLYENDSSSEREYIPADEYLSGNVREKLNIARKMAQIYPNNYAVNVESLEKVQPKDLSASEISVRLGATWVPPEIVEDFMFNLLDTPRYAQWNIKVNFSKYNGEWNVSGKTYDRGNVKAYSTYGTTRINAYKIIDETLNLRDVRIFDYFEDENGKRKAVLNKNETAIAQSKQELIKQAFKDWIWEDLERREILTKLYNEKFNSIRPREFDGSHINFVGMNPEIELREHQKNAVAHILYGGNTLLAHCVGAGKTFEMTAAAMESKRLGLCSKSLFVVPNHLTEQWASEFLQLYPSANILVATKKDFETKNRKRFCGRIATGDYDAVIIGHSQFEKIPMSIERQRAVLQNQIDDVIEGIADLKRNRGDNFSVKQLEKTKRALKTKLEKLNDQSRKDDVVTFEELGVDRLFVDESHFYKNLFLYTKMRNVGGIAQTEAQKSSDLFMKCRYLDELTGGRGTVFATGTPISNSMVELYTIQRYLQYNTLQKNNLQNFDAWASTFGETVTAVELTPEGSGYRAKTRFARFYNLPELMAMFKEVADIQTSDMLNLPVPTPHYHNVALKPSQIQKDLVASLSERADKVRNGMVDSTVDNMLLITNDGRKLALDQRLTNDMLPDFEGSKVNACVENIYKIWDETSEKKSAQLVFCDLSTPKNDGSFNVYDDIKKKLVAKGIPDNEVKFIHEADTETKKQELFKKVRKGEVRVLMGSTFKMGAGTNAQDKLIALHDIDCPWRPSDLEQRSGRIIRQGNENKDVEIYRYVTEETFDAYLYQLVEGKQKFASQIMTSKSPVRSAEDIDETALSYAEIKMLATGNPYIKEKMDLDIQVQKLRLLKSNYLTEKYALQDKIIKYYPEEITRIKDNIKGFENDIETVKKHPKSIDDKFIGMEIKGVSFSEKADAGNAILEVCKEMTSPQAKPLGIYRGFPLDIYFETFSREYRLKIKGELTYTVALGSDTFGNITRLDNALDGLPKKLETAKEQLINTEKQVETAKQDVEKPFSQEEELSTKMARLNELNALLNVDKKENEMVDDGPDESSVEPKKEKEYER